MNKFLFLVVSLSLTACSGISNNITLPFPAQTEQTASISSSKTPQPASVYLASTNSNKYSQKSILKNDTQVSLDFTELQMSIQAPNPNVISFSVDTSQCLKVLKPQESCELNFTFDPSQVAGQFTEAFAYAETTDSTNTTYRAAFQLNGVAETPGLAPNSPYNDGTLSITTESDVSTGLRMVVIKNSSNGPVKSLKPGSYGDLSLYLNSCSEVLLAGEQCLIYLSESGMSNKAQNVVVSYSATDYNGHSLSGSVTTTSASNN